MPGAIRLRPDQEEDIPRVRDALRRNRRLLLVRPTGPCCSASSPRSSRRTGADRSIDTIARRLGAYQPDDFRLVFVDEAHHAAAPSWRRVIDHFAEAYIVGFTATPQRRDGKGVDHLFGELVSSRTVKDYVNFGVLAPAVTFAPPEPPDLSGIRRRLGDYEQTALAERMSDRAIGDAVEHYKKLSPQLPGLVYCCSVRRSQLVAETFSATGYAARRRDTGGRAQGDNQRPPRWQARPDHQRRVVHRGSRRAAVGHCHHIAPDRVACTASADVGQSDAPRGKRRGLILDHAGNTLRHGLHDFEHQWSLEGRPKKTGEPLVRRCPECGVMLPTKAQSCSECGYQFVVQMQPACIPEATAGDLEQIDGRNMLDAEQLRHMPYRRLLDWCGTDNIRLELARRARGYRQGWKFHAKQARLAAMASVE